MSSVIGKVYKIVCNITDEVYIGSTCQTMRNRMNSHRGDARRGYKNVCMSSIIINRGDYKVDVLEEFPYENENQRRWRERHYYDMIENINKTPPIRSAEEKRKYQSDVNKARRLCPIFCKAEKERMRILRINNVEKLAAQGKKYREDNAEQIRITKARHYQANAETVKSNVREYYQNNIEKVATYNHERYEKAKKDGKHVGVSCGCGGSYNMTTKTRHCRTLKHTKWIEDGMPIV